MGALDELVARSPELQRAAQDERERKEREDRLARAESDFPYFCDTYLKDYFYCGPAEYQRILYDMIQSRELTAMQAARLKELVPGKYQDYFKPAKDIKGIVDVEPRQHGKSTRMTFAYPLWCLLFHKANFILIIGASDDDAQLQMDNIRFALEENDRILADFGLRKGSPWNKGFLRLADGPTVMAKGKGGSLRGRRNKQYRPDLIIVDDTMKDDESDSSQQRDKVCRWFNRTIQPLGTDALIVVVNTITNEDDLPSRLLNDIKAGTKKGWVGLRFSAQVPDRDDPKGWRPLWPERYTHEDLERIRSNIGSLAYAIEFLSEPLNDDDRIFKPAWIQRIRTEEIPSGSDWVAYEGIDPATGAHDMSAVVDIRRNSRTGEVVVVSSHGKKESTESFAERLIQRYRIFRYRKAFMENVTFQNVYRKQVISKAEAQHVHLPLSGKAPGSASKATRLMYISPMVENGTIRFAPGNEALIDQLTGFPAAGYDDLCDALYYAVLASESKGGGEAYTGTRYRMREVYDILAGGRRRGR